jgi:hypothetical protein
LWVKDKPLGHIWKTVEYDVINGIRNLYTEHSTPIAGNDYQIAHNMAHVFCDIKLWDDEHHKNDFESIFENLRKSFQKIDKLKKKYPSSFSSKNSQNSV